MTKQKWVKKRGKFVPSCEGKPLEHYFKNEKKLSDKAMDKIEKKITPSQDLKDKFFVFEFNVFESPDKQSKIGDFTL